MKRMFKFKTIVLVLSVMTMLYLVAFYQSVQAYNSWKQSEIERYAREYGGTEEYWEGLVDFWPYCQTKTGRYFFWIGFALLLTWVIVIALKRCF